MKNGLLGVTDEGGGLLSECVCEGGSMPGPLW